jgi:hypothetical protein
VALGVRFSKKNSLNKPNLSLVRGRRDYWEMALGLRFSKKEKKIA